MRNNMIYDHCNLAEDYFPGYDEYHFHERLIVLRSYHYGNRIKAFADTLQIPVNDLILYEKGTLRPSIDLLIHISKTFHVSVDWLLGVEEYKGY